MRPVSVEAMAALRERAVTLRDFLWIVARDRDTGAEVPYGVWSDLGPISASVIDPETGAPVARGYEGAGGLVDISGVPLVSDLTAQTVTVTVSQVADINDLIRAYEVRRARIEVHRGLFHVGTLAQLTPAFPRFVGFVDEASIRTPPEGELGGIELTCVSHAQELGRSNTATRSDAHMQRRNPGDTFRRHAAAVGSWELRWGQPT